MTIVLADHHTPPPRYCTRCCARVPNKSAAHGGSFCSPKCRYQDKKERRAWRAAKACRLCGRAARKQKIALSECAPGVHILGVIAQTELLAAQAAIGGIHG